MFEGMSEGVLQGVLMLMDVLVESVVRMYGCAPTYGCHDLGITVRHPMYGFFTRIKIGSKFDGSIYERCFS